MTDIQLKGGHVTSDPRLDRIYEQDLRSLNFLVREQVRTADIRLPRSYTWSCPLWLNQGNEGACVGAGYAHDLAAKPVPVSGLTMQYAREALYFRIQREDPWEGGAYPGATPFYEGTSVLTGAKVLTDLGYYQSYSWALNAREVAMGIRYSAGPGILGLNWYPGMFDTDANGFIHPTGQVAGGHCIAAIGVRIIWNAGSANAGWDDVDMEKSYILLHNSWGSGWGINGRAKLSLSNLDRLLAEHGDACFPKRNTLIRQVLPHAA